MPAPQGELMVQPLPESTVRSEIRRRLPRFRFRMEIFDSPLARALTSCQAWLDLGCGRNDLLAEFVGARLQVGADPVRHPSLVREPGCHFVQARAKYLPFRDSSFQLVTMRQVVEHLRDPLAVFAEVHRVLKPGGRLLIVTTNREAPLVWLGRRMPLRLKMLLLRRLYGKAEKDVYPTFHRWNTWRRLMQPPPGFRTGRLLSTENPVRENPWLLQLSVLWMRLTEAASLQAYWSSLIAEYERM